MDDLLVMGRLQAGDPAALDELIDRYWQPIVAYSCQMAVDQDSACDVAQEVFMRLWRRRERWDPRGSVRVWLFRTARNLIISEHRKQKVRARLINIVETVRTPLDDAEDEELQQAITVALRCLSERRREAFTLFFLRGLSYREIADIMSIQPQSVANHLQAAIAQLRSALVEFFPGCAPPQISRLLAQNPD